MPHRSRIENRKYRKFSASLPKPASCQFCTINTNDPHFIEETTNFWVIENIVPYSLWDEHGVIDHLLIVPKAHTDTLSSLSAEAALEFVKLMSGYEKSGYSVYARHPNNPNKSVVHQHTHLIKGDTKRRRFLLFLERPYFRYSR